MLMHALVCTCTHELLGRSAFTFAVAGAAINVCSNENLLSIEAACAQIVRTVHKLWPLLEPVHCSYILSICRLSGQWVILAGHADGHSISTQAV